MLDTKSPTWKLRCAISFFLNTGRVNEELGQAKSEENKKELEALPPLTQNILAVGIPSAEAVGLPSLRIVAKTVKCDDESSYNSFEMNKQTIITGQDAEGRDTSGMVTPMGKQIYTGPMFEGGQH
jgi:hypothetical protein